MSSRQIRFGKAGEALACQELERRGYAILARRFRCRYGELDIIASDGPTLVFVEVKSRSSHSFGAAAEAVTVRKRRTMMVVARYFMVRHRLTACRCRFDIVSIHLGLEHPVIEVIQNAFDA
jgi:putative endonuclease